MEQKNTHLNDEEVLSSMMKKTRSLVDSGGEFLNCLDSGRESNFPLLGYEVEGKIFQILHVALVFPTVRKVRFSIILLVFLTCWSFYCVFLYSSIYVLFFSLIAAEI
jgi:hypothetical protein